MHLSDNIHMIPIGTIISSSTAADDIPKAAALGFECFQIHYWLSTGAENVTENAKKIRDAAQAANVQISSVGVYGNPLWQEGDFADTYASFERVIDAAPTMGAPIITGFTGRLPDGPLPDSLPRFKEVWGELARRAADKGLKIAWENCDMGDTWKKGHWNMATRPEAWDMLFNALPMDNIGLEWEPAHQMAYLIDPIAQLREWVGKVIHVHGKDATIEWDSIRRFGLGGSQQFIYDRTPGFGDTNWTDVISILRRAGYKGTIDIEGFHDPIYRRELEWTGQCRALRYLKECRGGDYVPNL